MARSRRKRRDASDRLTGIVLVAIGLLLVAALASGAWWLRKSKIQLDAENCPKNGVRAIHLIMIDRSDPISQQQAQRIRQYMQKSKDEAAFGTRFDIYTFEGDVKTELRPILRICAPGRPEEANELIQNPELIRRQYEERFSAVIDHTIDSLLRESTRPNSPIIESLRAAAITSFGGRDAAKIPLKATLISDMVQHTASISHFKTIPNFAALAKSSNWALVRPALHGANVQILYLLRPEAKRGGAQIQNRGHELFWEQLIEASDGHTIGFEPI